MNIKELYTVFLSANGVSTDTRTLEAGQIFFALRGENFDGNRFVSQALEQGARMAVTDDNSLEKEEHVFIVDSALEALQALANYHRKQKDLTVLAITGSNGKTTTKELIAQVLSSGYPTLYTEGNLNNHIGLPLTLLRLTEERIAVIEMGANHPGEIELLCKIAEPDLGIITNIGKAHLEGFGSFEGVKKAKGELYDYLAGEGKSILINSSDQLLVEMAESRGLKGVEYALNTHAGVSGKITATRPFLEGVITIDGHEYSLSTRMLGAYNFLNLLAAISAGIYFGIEVEDILGRLADYSPGNNRSQIAEGKSNTLFLDAYNANPSSMRASLEDFVAGEELMKMAILGEMLELGNESEAEHSSLLNWLKGAGIQKVILIGEQFVKMSEKGEYPFLFFHDVEECMVYLSKHTPSGYRILLKGSRKNALEQATNLLLNC